MKQQQQGEGGGSSSNRSKTSMSKGQDPGGVNIKIIETHTVHTDVTHFKSVVQGLTGKDSVPAGKLPESSGRNVQQKVDNGGGDGKGKGEFDDILKIKLPSPEELREFWDD